MITGQDQKDYEAIRWADGLYLGGLTDQELQGFYRLRAKGLASSNYQGTAGLLGVGKIELLPSETFYAQLRADDRRRGYEPEGWENEAAMLAVEGRSMFDTV